MYNTSDFLSSVLPSETQNNFYILCAISGKQRVQQGYPTIDSLLTMAQHFSNHNYDVYFGLGSSNSMQFRKKENMQLYNCIWIDLDCGKDKEYATQDEAQAALTQFEADNSFPHTWLVNSGYGIHAYWVFTESVAIDTWSNIADLIKKRGLRFDSKALLPTQILRVPGTNNYKYNTCVPVTILDHTDAIYDPHDLITRWTPTAAPSKTEKDLCAYLAAAWSDTAAIPHEHIAELVLNCEQVRTMAVADEPTWHACICLLNMYENSADVIHTLSGEDADRYNYDDCAAKIAASKACPILCATLDSLRPGICKNCTHFGHIASPVQIATPAQEVDWLKAIEPDVIPFTPDNRANFFVDETGTYMTTYDANQDKAVKELISNQQLYFYKKLQSDDMLSLAFVILQGRTLVNRGEMPIGQFMTMDVEARQQINNLGFFPSNSYTRQPWMDFTTSYASAFASQAPVTHSYSHYGWQKDASFVIDTERFKDGKSFPCVTTVPDSIRDVVTSAGSLDEWKKLVSTYTGVYNGVNDPEITPQPLPQLAICMALAAPYMRLCANGGNALFNMISQRSGTGKTTCMRVAASVWGNPKQNFVTTTTSFTSRFRLLGLLSNLPMFMDELALDEPERLLPFVMDFSSGMEKLSQTSNRDIRERNLWNTVLFAASNFSLRERLLDAKGDTDAAARRVIEFDFDSPQYVAGSRPWQAFADMIVGIRSHYGLAGREFLLRCPDITDDVIADVTTEWFKKRQANAASRFIEEPIAVALYIGRRAVDAGILPFNMDLVEEFVLKVKAQEDVDTKPVFEVDENNKQILTRFINSIMTNNCLRVVSADRPANMAIPQHKLITDPDFDQYVVSLPKDDLKARLEMDTGTLYIAVSAFHEWCKDGRRKYSARAILQSLYKSGYIRQDMVILGKDVPLYHGINTRCRVFVIN